MSKLQTEIIRVDARKIMLLEENAHFMRHETFQRLVANVEDDGALTSVPFCAIKGYYDETCQIIRDDTGEPIWEVLSGNHRIKATIAAQVYDIDIMVTRQALSMDRRIAIALSHNSIFGEDDPATLKRLYEKIGDVDLRVYSGLDDKQLGLLEPVKVESLSEANLSFMTLSLVFLPQDFDRAKELLMEAIKMIDSDETWIASHEAYDRMLDGLDATSKSHGIKNTATAIMLMLEVFERHRTTLQEGWLNADDTVKHKNWVPLASIFNTDVVPSEAAVIINQAVRRMNRRGEISDNALWKAIENLCADYLSGPDAREGGETDVQNAADAD